MVEEAALVLSKGIGACNFCLHCETLCYVGHQESTLQEYDQLGLLLCRNLLYESGLRYYLCRFLKFPTLGV